MKVTKQVIKVRDLFEKYSDQQEQGVTGYGGKLNIRPPYQREFIYKPEQQIAVIKSMLGGMPLSCMYWAVNEDGSYEVLDGQQRTMSICRFLNSNFAIDYHFFSDMSQSEKETLLDYELDIYFCEGDTRDKIKWFETINIAGEKLTKQELRNAIFTGPWVLDAKRYFSKTNCAASQISDGYVKGSTVRQELLELAIGWASDGEIDNYMSENRNKPDARELWQYFQDVINWVKRTFVTAHPKLMTSVNWGKLYNEFKDKGFNPIELDRRVNELLSDEDVTNQKGIFTYLLTGEEKHLSIRAFPANVKNRIYTKQGGHCVHCGEHTPITGMEADHITPWSEGGHTTEENCQLLCKKCNRTKSNK